MIAEVKRRTRRPVNRSPVCVIFGTDRIRSAKTICKTIYYKTIY